MHIRVKLMQLKESRSGNFAILTAAALPVLIGAAGIAIDLARAMEEKHNLQAIADAATLTAASRIAKDRQISHEDAKNIAKKLYLEREIEKIRKSDMSDEEKEKAIDKLKDAIRVTVESLRSNGSDIYTIHLESNLPMPLSGLTSVFGIDTLRLSVNSKAVSSSRGANPLSMYLVLDESGSMAKDTDMTDSNNPNKTTKVMKMEALKNAAGLLTARLDTGEAGSVRMGAVAYNHLTRNEQVLKWGTTAARTYVDALPEPPEGGTHAAEALYVARSELSGSTEANAHKSRGNASFERAIVFMTDGEMTRGSKFDPNRHRAALNQCQKAKSDGIEIYAVAFMAPPNGQKLLKECASSQDHYYEPENMNTLIKSLAQNSY